MYIEKKLLLNIVDKTNANQATQSEIKTDGANLDKVITPDTVITIGGSTIGFVILWAGFLLVVSKIRSFREDNKLFFPINSLHQVPCRNCRYFSSNHYLQCAVQPSVVLTEQATNCPDYCPKHGKFPHKNQ